MCLFPSPAPNTPHVPLLSWKKAQESVPWNIILLLGGGFAMAKGCEVDVGLALIHDDINCISHTCSWLHFLETALATTLHAH